MRSYVCTSLLLASLVGCSRESADTTALQPALDAITADGMLAHVNRLASDGFEGRAPGTPGEDSTVAYLTAQFQALGLAPGNPDGSFVQNVEMVGFTGRPTASYTIGGQTVELAFPDEFVAVSRHDAPEVNVRNSELVFVGYGIVAPEYGWDDYKGLDVRGKTLVMLVNDPPIPDPNDSTQLDSTMFRGKAMTYYGRWTYKYEIATEKGAAAVLLVHETGPAGYPYEVVVGSWGRENLDVVSSGPNRRIPVEGWISEATARRMFLAAGRNFDGVKRAAANETFTPAPLFGTASFRVRNTTRRIQSKNVIAKLEGSDPELRNEYVIYTAHWDHLGRDPNLQGDQIFNGALDNATGTAQMLEIARGLSQLPTKPRRSVLFLAVTAEESGLLGAKYYASNPLYPLDRTLANINIDGVNQWGRTSDLVVIGLGNSTLDDELRTVATAAGRTIVPDAEPEKGFFYRSDHFEFAKQGVPALFTDAGVQFIGKPADYGTTKRNEYTTNDYHKPSDDVKADWDLSGAVEDARLLLEVGYRVAQGGTWPQWKPGTEFKAKRDSALAASQRP
ncbi:MAG TPA: M28 family peptidase [Gemmatimonadaceae bacterium]|nr:M28 family peptidase [Gemmatimonadaceae bacterium]